jgi:RNA polymerase sigma-70 factor (ECF subfamily)
LLDESASGKPSDPVVREAVHFDDVYHEYFPFVWRGLRRVGVAPSALDDAVQDVFLVVHRRLAELDGQLLIRSWLSAILVRVASDHRRRVRRRDEPTRSEAEGPGFDSLPDPRAITPQRSAERNDDLRMLHRVLDDLDWEKREVFVLVELEQLSCPEVAEALGIPTNTVSSRLRAARRDFSQVLARHRASDEWRLR